MVKPDWEAIESASEADSMANSILSLNQQHSWLLQD